MTITHPKLKLTLLGVQQLAQVFSLPLLTLLGLISVNFRSGMKRNSFPVCLFQKFLNFFDDRKNLPSELFSHKQFPIGKISFQVLENLILGSLHTMKQALNSALRFKLSLVSSIASSILGSQLQFKQCIA